MSYSDHRPTDGDFILDERKLAALSVLDSAAQSGWFTDADLETALENSSLRPSFALKLDRCLENYKDENRGRWPLGAMTLLRAFNSYLELDADVLAHALNAERRSA